MASKHVRYEKQKTSERGKSGGVNLKPARVGVWSGVTKVPPETGSGPKLGAGAGARLWEAVKSKDNMGQRPGLKRQSDQATLGVLAQHNGPDQRPGTPPLSGKAPLPSGRLHSSATEDGVRPPRVSLKTERGEQSKRGSGEPVTAPGRRFKCRPRTRGKRSLECNSTQRNTRGSRNKS
ncbi:hypothetical protein AAG570_011721 [Ranatra chinensis]|uniref:Uncharacterized protein n=1 Tax=Ranatra chinensis TaxID=642074 RepID=A0ABD0YGQ6_9HEMI